MLELQELEKRIGYQFKNRALLRRATTHRSFSADHNERLEFLGDSVLGCTIGYELFKLDSHFSEGRLSRVRSNLVCEKALDEIAADVGISDFLLMGEGEVKSGGRTRPSILADAMEAVFGAVFLDGGFEKIEKPFNNYFDLAVSNIPFGDIAVFDAEFQRSDSFGRRSAQNAIHNYFFLKGLDTVRDGGIVAFITSQGVLNSTKTSVRNELFRQANLVSAVRLPNNLFTDNAGTEVGSDLIVLQKHLNKKEMSQDERLMTVIQTDTKTDLTDNAYFIHHPERIVHTTAKLDTDPYGKPAMVYLHEGKTAGISGDLRRMLDEDFHYRLAMRLYSGTIRQSGTEEKVTGFAV